jgi:predicted ArsR family transcriptional regulator
MYLPFDENPTRQQVLTLLKKNSPMTVAEMSRQMDITHMAVRQHLMYLERKGNIKYKVKKSGIGRPVFQYRLTEKADEIFPKAYGEFLADVLTVVEDMEGKEKLATIFRGRKDLLVQKYGKALSKGENVSERVKILAGLLDADGAMAEVKEENGSIRLLEYNCLLQRVAEKYPEVCDHELELYRDLLGKDVVRAQCLRDGGASCEYIIPGA